jgi:ABC-type nitrate/sulfonate/bicarbonate transport system permease component
MTASGEPSDRFVTHPAERSLARRSLAPLVAGVRVMRLKKLLVPMLIIGAWVAVTEANLVANIFLPPLGDVWEAFRAMEDRLPGALAQSVSMTLVGFFIGTLLGITLGLAMAYSLTVRELFGGVLDFIRPVPVFALIPLFVLWFGIGRMPQIVLIALGTSVILGVTTIEAIRNIAPVYVRAALTLGASRLDIYRTVIVPSIVPHLMGAIRVAAAASWGLDVAAEFIGAQNGLGYLMIVQQTYLNTAGIIVIVLIYSLLALGLDTLIRFAERPVTRWTERGVRHGVVAAIVGRA